MKSRMLTAMLAVVLTAVLAVGGAFERDLVARRVLLGSPQETPIYFLTLYDGTLSTYATYGAVSPSSVEVPGLLRYTTLNKLLWGWVEPPANALRLSEADPILQVAYGWPFRCLVLTYRLSGTHDGLAIPSVQFPAGFRLYNCVYRPSPGSWTIVNLDYAFPTRVYWLNFVLNVLTIFVACRLLHGIGWRAMKWRRRSAGRCVYCGYPAMSDQGRCPECGKAPLDGRRSVAPEEKCVAVATNHSPAATEGGG